MRIQIRGRDGPVSDALRTHVERRIGFALSRFGERVDRVTVRFSEAGDPPGGTEERCHIHVALRPSGGIEVEDAGRDRFIAVNGAADPASRSVARTLARERYTSGGQPETGGHKKPKP